MDFEMQSKKNISIFILTPPPKKKRRILGCFGSFDVGSLVFKNMNINGINMIINTWMAALWQIGAAAASLFLRLLFCYTNRLFFFRSSSSSPFLSFSAVLDFGIEVYRRHKRNIHHNHTIHSAQFHSIWSVCLYMHALSILLHSINSKANGKKGKKWQDVRVLIPKLIARYYWFRDL